MRPATGVDDRTHLGECGICHAAEGQPCDYPGTHVGRNWRIGITAPGAGIGRGDDCLRADHGRCRPTIEDNCEWDHTIRDSSCASHSHRVARLHRGGCLGCGWHSDRHHIPENGAVEDAHDHAWPGWRELPVISARLFHDANAKQTRRWLDSIISLYRATGIDIDRWAPGSGAPIRTLRQPMGTRSHWTPVTRGYDICAGIWTPAPPATHVEADQQLTLF